MSLRILSIAVALAVLTDISVAGTLSISIDNPPEKGSVELKLYDSANTFGDSRDPVKQVRFEVNKDNLYRVDGLKPGKYALIIYSDENDNGLMDRNFIGIPKEPVGFANRYRPKGPPSYSKAVFDVKSGADSHFDVELYNPLGKLGRLGVGVGLISRSSPYRDYSGDVNQFIPAVTYVGERLQIYGPEMKLGLVGSDKMRLAAVGKYRIGVYEEEDSPFLEGMGDPESTFMAGLALIAELPGGIDISAGYNHDALDKIGGGEAKLELDKTFQFGSFRFSPQIGVSRLSKDLGNNDFGVSADKAGPDRPEYELDESISFHAGMQIMVELRQNMMILVNTDIEFLDDEVTDSPIVSEDYVIESFGVITYLF